MGESFVGVELPRDFVHFVQWPKQSNLFSTPFLSNFITFIYLSFADRSNKARSS